MRRDATFLIKSIPGLSVRKNKALYPKDLSFRYSGRAIGVGTSDILGGIDDLKLRIGPINFKNKISILRNSRCDFLIGLDILRRFKCEISFRERFIRLEAKKNIIRVPLLSSAVLHNDGLHAEYVNAQKKDAMQDSYERRRSSRYLEAIRDEDFNSPEEDQLQEVFGRGSRSIDRYDEGEEEQEGEYDEENFHYSCEDVLCNNVSMEGV